MLSKYWDLDFYEIYPVPTAEQFAIKYLNELYLKLHCFDFSLLITFYGRHRTGKSLAAVSIANMLDPTFEPNLEHRVVYTAQAFISEMKKIRAERIKGAGIIFDEAGAGELSNERWYEETAKIINAELQACGYLNPFIAFVTPNFGFINTHARKLSQAVYEMNRTHMAYAEIKPLWIRSTPWTSSLMRNYPIVCEMVNGTMSNVYKITRLKINLPPKDIMNRYNKVSQSFKDQLMDASEDELKASAAERKQRMAKSVSIDTIVTEVYKNRKEFLRTPRGKAPYINEELVRHRYKLSARDARLVKALVEKDISKLKSG